MFYNTFLDKASSLFNLYNIKNCKGKFFQGEWNIFREKFLQSYTYIAISSQSSRWHK